MGKKSPVITLTSICRIVAVMFVAISGSLCNGLTEGRAADEIQDGPVLPSRVTEDQKIRHVLNRLTFGPTAGDVDNVKRIGLHNFIERELHPSAIQEPGALERALAELPSLRMNPVEIFRTYGRRPKDTKLMSEEDRQNLRRKMVRVMQEAVRARILRSLYSERQLQEVLTDFWFNHFNVFAGKGLDRIWVGSYERDAIMPHVLGKFRTLLGATARHPAMLFYLDNWLNTAPNSPGARGRFKGLNENYARELLELHTLGVDGGYTQKDVVNLARILTGWGILTPAIRQRMRTGWKKASLSEVRAAMGSAQATGFFFDTSRHDFSDKVFLGRIIKGRGRQEVTEILDMLADHPSTARHICHKLARCFVADDPPKELVGRMAKVFQESGGDIREVMKLLFNSKEFWDPQYFGAKLKSPYRYVLSALRATGVAVENHVLVQRILRGMGMPLYGNLTPDGYKNTAEEWLSPDSMTKRINFSMALANGRLQLAKRPSEDPDGVAAPILADDAQKTPIDFRTLISMMDKVLSPATLRAVAEAPPRVKAGMVLASPEFMQY